MGQALAKLAEEDPTFKVATDEETGQTVISGMGELHLEILVDRLKREFKVECNQGAPQVKYKEAITGTVEYRELYKKQTGGRGKFADIHVRIEPQTDATKTGLEFIDAIKGGVIPKEFIPSVEYGCRQAAKTGVLAGYPLINVKVELFDGSYHDVDSSQIAFEQAGILAMQAGVKKAKPCLLEPIMKLQVVTPIEFAGPVQGDISSRRAMIENAEQRGNTQVIDATVPLASMFGYSTILRSLTQGRATYTMEPHSYAQVPSNVQQEIIAAQK